MNKKIILLAILFVSIGSLSGCITTNSNDENNEIQENPQYVIMDTGAQRNENAEIQYAYVEIQNIDTKTIKFTVNFTFGVIDEANLGSSGDYGGGGTSTSSDPYDYSYNLDKTEYIEPHETEKIICYTTIQPNTNITTNWDYEITAEFNS